ncbi:MAG TPA: hypothetical protein VNQ48_02565 [Microbacteriaceae bacterium]|nr:hypothetical protein [Microbacteriaceae bacterium]
MIAKALEGIEKPRCVYTKRNKERCKNAPIKGGTVCRKHGGAAAHIQRKARERLQSMIVPALVELNKILVAPGTSDGDKLRAISMVLDRTGYGKESNHLHTVEVKPWEKTMEAIVVELSGETEDVQDAEIVEESALPAPEPSKHEFDGPRIGPGIDGNVTVLSSGVPHIKSDVERPARRRPNDD